MGASLDDHMRDAYLVAVAKWHDLTMITRTARDSVTQVLLY